MPENVFFSGKAVRGATYRRKKSAAMRACFCVALNFNAAVVTEKARLF
jgi:hypothetical protein